MTPLPDTSPNAGMLRATLDRHQLRREQGVPTLSVLVGEAEAAASAWQAWVRFAGRGPGHIARWPETADELNEFGGKAVLFMDTPAGNDEAARARRLAAAVGHLSKLLISADPDRARAAWAVAVTDRDAAGYLRGEAYSRARALFMEGTVELPAAPPADVGRFAAGALAGSAALLARNGTRPETGERFQEAAAACQDAGSPGTGKDADDRARSAAERFLFDLLNDLPATAGLFGLNVRLGFCFGPMRAEVDLLATSLSLAVEIDGYHHFRDPENYRRDRRKDALLQKEGYFVLRFLAEDVVVHLETVLEEILAAVAFRRITR